MQEKIKQYEVSERNSSRQDKEDKKVDELELTSMPIDKAAGGSFRPHPVRACTDLSIGPPRLLPSWRRIQEPSGALKNLCYHNHLNAIV